MHDLPEVRRYWPRARYAGWNWHGWQSEDEPGVLYMRYSSERRWWRKRYELCLDEEQGGWRVIDSNWYQIGRGDTIAEAMRAAGFGRRKPGFHSMLNLKMSEWHRYWLDTLGQNWRKLLWESGFPKTYATRQRPRKGARLGRRKREALRRIEELEAKP